MTDPAQIAKALTPAQRVVFEAIKFANWAAGQGVTPIDGEDASPPEEFLMAYSETTGDEDWESLPIRIAQTIRKTPLKMMSPLTPAQRDALLEIRQREDRLDESRFSESTGLSVYGLASAGLLSISETCDGKFAKLTYLGRAVAAELEG